MIYIKNQFVVQFNLGNKFTDFVTPENFQYMTIIQNAGGFRPVLTLCFLVYDKDIIPYLNQGNIISIRYGATQLNTDALQFIITADSKVPQYGSGVQVTITAGMYNPAFTNNQGTQTYTGKSFEVLQEICESCALKFNTNVTKSNDKQTWSQDGKTLWELTSDIADRSYKNDTTFFAHGFDNSNFYFYDVKDLLGKGPKWYLTCGDMGKDENSPVVNISTYFPDSSMLGTMTQLAGTNSATVGYNLDTGDFSCPMYKLKTFTTTGTNNININDTGCAKYNYMITTGDEHENTLLALNQNKRNQALFSSYTVRVPIPMQYRDFHLLDVVQLVPSETDYECEGLYIISGITIEIKDKIFQINLTLNRESANNIKGDLAEGEK